MTADEGARPPSEGERRRDEGLQRTTHAGQHPWLTQARRAALLHAARHGQVTAEDVRKAVPIPEGVHPSAMGAVFRTDLLEPQGLAQAEHAEGHARTIRTWALTEKGRAWAAAQGEGGQRRLFPTPPPQREEGPAR